ncbi:hemolysin III family protein [Sodalis sp. CWE]|uniref:PAQR family membrane homeostasis protein TrhA n=1 Tax=Sodalis sp. CWE TaxID=2803816 RepID=UPI001C7DD4BF|nr:hemolysin III family protein [Sodalis sp. CWE]MBX4180890.1 hemolysin III family protein [Sodalis sp. CWE]
MENKSLIKQYSLIEEIISSVTHGLGVVFSIIGLILMLNQAEKSGANALVMMSYGLYGGSMILLYLSSTLYHAITNLRTKNWLKKIDHCAIYVLIAGTYTPLLLVVLASSIAKWLVITIWIMAISGIIFKLVINRSFRIISIITYLSMGWFSIILIYQLFQKLPITNFLLLSAGGMIYSLGVVFYLWERIPFNHAIWHGFVLIGTVCHFLAIHLFEN